MRLNETVVKLDISQTLTLVYNTSKIWDPDLEQIFSTLYDLKYKPDKSGCKI